MNLLKDLFLHKIFLSYRRSDSQDIVDRISERLIKHFGKDAIFYDVDTIPYGYDFWKFINEKLNECGVLLAIIGNNWIDAQYSERTNYMRRLDDPSDFVRIEIERALTRNKLVIPVLVGRTTMPVESILPNSLKKLSTLQCAEVFSGWEFHRRVDKLIKQIESIIGPVNKYIQGFSSFKR